MCLTAKNFGLLEENINSSNPPGKTTRWGTRERERETWTEGRERAVLYFTKNEDKSLTDSLRFLRAD